MAAATGQQKLILHTQPGNKNSWKALIAAEYVGAKIEVPGNFDWAKIKTSEFLKLNPNGKVPTLETPQGGIFESNAIARYVARLADKGLFGSTLLDAAFVESWIDFATGEVDAPLCSWTYPHFGYVPYDKKKETAAQDAVKKALGTLDAYLQSHTFLVGDAVTLADIITFCNLWHGFNKAFDPEYRKAFPNVERYFLTLAAQPQFKKITADVKLPTEPLKYTPQKEGKKEAAKPKEAAAPAPAATASATEEKKAKNPLDLLPPTKMALDSWKRLYSNAPAAKFREIAVNGLWNGADVPNSPTKEHFVGYDPEGYSLWFCDYKYTDENTVNFVVMNKVGGMLQRVDYIRKYGFAVMCILKNDQGQFPIRGVWMFRGHDIPQIMKDECFDLDLYEWKKVDLGDEAQKKRVEDMIAEEATIDGLENVECKVFK